MEIDKENLQRNINKKLDEAQEKIEENYKRMKKELDKTREKAEWYVRYHPKKAVFISLGAGAIIGMLIAAVIKKKRNRCW